MYYLNINETLTIPFSKETRLSELLQSAGFAFSMPCGGKGSCGKCKVTAVGYLSPLCDREKELLSPQEIQNGIRLACLCNVTGNATVRTEAYRPETEITFSLPETATDFSFENGLVIDIGTTTVAAILYQNRQAVKTITAPNLQAAFGADVISRISAEEKQPGTLSGILRNQIQEMIAACNTPKRVVIVANTAMLHFLTAQNVLPLGVAPYQTADIFGKTYPLFGTECYLPPCVSAFVGADITAGILASRMAEKKEAAMLIDLGTNGEIAYFDGSMLHTASTAAGPALEGAGIFMGMPAKNGAINHVFYENGKIRYTTVGNTAPVGICGSGLIDAVAAMLECGALEESGVIAENHPLCRENADGEAFFKLPESDIIITAKDIRQLQLAKAAIHAGMLTLANHVDTLYIAGGFGNSLNTENAIRIGLLPKHFCQNICILGNAALSGGSLLLFSDSKRETIQKIASLCQPVDLSQSLTFTENYMKKMFF